MPPGLDGCSVVDLPLYGINALGEQAGIILADGPVPAKEVEAQAKEAGVREATLRRAKIRLSVTATKVGFRFHPAVWHWSLPKVLTDPVPKTLATFGELWPSS